MKEKDLFKINLQLFAEGEENKEEPIINSVPEIKNDEQIVTDNEITVDPSDDLLKQYEEKQRLREERKNRKKK